MTFVRYFKIRYLLCQIQILDILFKRRLVILYGKDEITLLLFDDVVGDILLSQKRIGGDDLALNVQFC